MRNASGKQGEMSGSEKQRKIKRTGTQAVKFFGSTYDIFSIKRVTRKFHIATTTAKKCTKKCAARAKLLFLLFLFWLIRPIDIFCRSRCCSRLASHDFIFLSKLVY